MGDRGILDEGADQAQELLVFGPLPGREEGGQFDVLDMPAGGRVGFMPDEDRPGRLPDQEPPVAVRAVMKFSGFLHGVPPLVRTTLDATPHWIQVRAARIVSSQRKSAPRGSA